MSNIAKRQDAPTPEAIEKVLMSGDLASLTTEQKTAYVKRVCDSLGLNILTRPFDFHTFQNKTVLYANRSAGDQLRKIHKVSITITGREKIGDSYVVTARARDRDGRDDESTGVVTLTNLKGDALANAMMKAETKAKRRVTLSICGLGMLDETEVETLKETPPEPRVVNQPIAKAKAAIAVVENDPGEVVCTFGTKFLNKKIKDLDPYELNNWVSHFRSDVESGKSKGRFLEFWNAAETYLSSIEVDSISDHLATGEEFPT